VVHRALASPFHYGAMRAALKALHKENGMISYRKGTAFFLNAGQGPFGVTASHVIDGWRRSCKEQEAGALFAARVFLQTGYRHRDQTAWLGMSDSNSGIRVRAMYLRYRDNSRWLGQKIASRDHSCLSCGAGDAQLMLSRQASPRGCC
jgi:hypothetical protein